MKHRKSPTGRAARPFNPPMHQMPPAWGAPVSAEAMRDLVFDKAAAMPLDPTPAQLTGLRDRYDWGRPSYVQQPTPARGPRPITNDQAREARAKLNLDQDGMARLMGVSRRSICEWEAKGVLSGPACVVYELILRGELPERFVPLEDAQGRAYPVADAT